MSSGNKDKKSETWKAKIVDLFGTADGPIGELFGIWQDKLKVQRYKKRIDLIRELEKDGYLEVEDKSLRRIIFDGESETDEGLDQ